jgi:hypothetical protein
MEFGKHIGKALLVFTHKALPAVYGFGFIFLVIRFLLAMEYGSFILIQVIFTMLMALRASFEFQFSINYAV